jgi:hypothetical protein
VAAVADDLAAWLVGLLADAGRKKLITLVLGSEQERALRQAATTAIQLTAKQLASGAQQAGTLAMVVNEVFRELKTETALAGQETLLQALQAGIAANLAVLDDVALTGTGQSSAETLGVAGGTLAETLTRHLVREIMFRGSDGGPLAPLANQLNHDVTHLQGRRIEGLLTHLAVQMALAQAGSTPAAPGKLVRLPPWPVSLVGREGLLADINSRLRSANGPGPRILALHGLGGAGKTSVAVEYAHRHLSEVGVAWLFPAGNPTALTAGFGELAGQLRPREGVEHEDRVALVHSALADYGPGWLLVFDNAPDKESVERFIPPAGGGRVLITSRNALWPRRQAVEVPVLGREVAAEFLTSQTGDSDEQAAAALADEVGGLPLALEQAAAYMQAVGESLTGYLALFRRRRSDLLRRGKPSGYGGTVATAWDLAFKQLEQSAPEAVGLLRLLAFCAPEAVPLRLLLQRQPGITERLSPQVAEVLVPLLEDELAADDAIAALRRYSLVRPAEDGAVSVHRLVQAVTDDQIPAELAGQWPRAAAALIEAAIPTGSRKRDRWRDFAALLPHAEKALARGSSGIERIAGYLGNSGSYAAARDLQQTVLAAREQTLNPKHPDILIARHNLAHWAGQAGDPAGARDRGWALLPLIAWALGAEHPGTLAVRADIAHWTRKARRRGSPDRERPDTLPARADRPRRGRQGEGPRRAAAQYDKLLPVLERIRGREHLDTLAARADLAWSTGEAGSPFEARDRFAALLPVVERVLGSEDPLTLGVHAGLARWTGSKRGVGDAASARDQFAALLPVYERVLGPGHPETLYIRHSVARWTGQAGDPARARDLYAVLLFERQRILGPNHPDTNAARKLLDYWTEQADPEAN